MFNVRVDTIRDRTTNGPTYMKGRQYYKQGMVRHLTYDQERGIIQAQVEGTRTYNVRIILNGQGDLHDATCTCSAFAAYWGLCRHIAAALLYCVDAFGQQKTHILPSEKKNEDPGLGHGEPAAHRPVGNPVSGKPYGLASPAESNSESSEQNSTQDVAQNGEAAAATGPASGIRRQQTGTRQQAQRKSRSKTRDFLGRMDHVLRLCESSDKQAVRLQVTLHCSPGSFTLPWLSFAVGETQCYPVSNVEQFAEAVSRDLSLELDKDFTFNPLQHTFLPQDLPLITMLQDAFENDYKAVFGTSHASSRDRYFTLNASRFAAFLSLSGGFSECRWQNIKDQNLQPIHVRQAPLPLRLRLVPDSPEGGPADLSGFRLELDSEQPVIQMTASRNIFLVGDTFFLPPPASIRIIEPVLAALNSPGLRQLILSRDEAAYLLGEIRPLLAPVCPLCVDSQIAGQIVDEPLEIHVSLECELGALRCLVAFHYGPVAISPLSAPPDSEDQNRLILRSRRREEALLQLILQAGFARHGTAWRLTDPDDQYNFLTQTLPRVAEMARLEWAPSCQGLRVLPPPAVQIRFSLSSDQQYLDFRQDAPGLPHDEYAAYLHALKDRRPYVRTADGGFRQVAQEDRERLLLVCDLLQLWGLDPATPSCQLPRYRVMALESLLADPGDNRLVEADESVRQMIRHLREPGTLRFRLPQALSGKLRPYQITGYHWLRSLDYYGLGGILADDMGLGKTLQTIAFVSAIWQKQKKPSLIIAPTSLVYNWLSEFERFAPRLPVMVLDGNRQQRTSRLGDINGQACAITSYSLLRRDIEELGACEFASCFLDEAQNIKNPETLNARSVKQMRADRYFALTGTPLENSLTELWSIFDFVLPGYLYNQKTFQSVFELPIIRDGSQEALDALHRQISPFVLRRMKRDVLTELPDKIETRAVCDMTEEQREIYQAFLLRSKKDLEQEVILNGYARSQIFILALLTRLRQICCHPALFMKHYQGGSGKLSLLEELLADSFSAGHRVLVFSQFTSMLDLIREGQHAAGNGVFYIDGQVTAEERMDQVQRFNQGEGRLFLISLRAGGTGLNLTGADTVIHFDPWWNPAVEEQATDRAYRIGQENVVQVIKLFTRHSIEEKIQQMQERKQHLIDRVIKPGQNLLSKMTLEEVRSLFEL